MDDIKQYRKSEFEIKGLISTVEVFSQNLDMNFDSNTWGYWSMTNKRTRNKR